MNFVWIHTQFSLKKKTELIGFVKRISPDSVVTQTYQISLKKEKKKRNISNRRATSPKTREFCTKQI
jgi:hypothetical protein